jgi:hypothetical protein
LNFRPLPYQGSALPLSYGSVPIRTSPRRHESQYTRLQRLARSAGPTAVDAASFPNPFAGSGLHNAVYHVGRKRLCCLLTPITAGKSGTPNHELLDRFVTLSLHRSMSQPPHITPKKSAERAAREARLAKALRENLVRRKEQKRAQEQRAVAQSDAPDSGSEPPG